MEESPASFRPILDRVLIKRIEPEATVEGFNIPGKYREYDNLGTILALGDGIVLGKEWKPLTDFVQVGDTVLYGEKCAEQFDRDGEIFWIVRLQDIRGVKGE